jgi:hypothetical protein
VRVFNRDEFCKEFPGFSKDPRYAFTPESFLLEVTPMEALTVAQLRELCLQAGEHPLAVQKALSVEGLGDSVIVRILREDLDILTRASSQRPETIVVPEVPAPKKKSKSDESPIAATDSQ